MMEGFYTWETTTLTLDVEPKEALDNVDGIVISIVQSAGRRIDKQAGDAVIDASEGTVKVYLTQEETALFRPGSAEVQVNLYYANHERDVSVKAKLNVYDNLYPKVMT